MNLLSINFGHDASLALFVDGELVQFEELERVSRLKHQYGLTSEQILSFIERKSISLHDIDLTTVCGTQFWVFSHSDDIKVVFGSLPSTPYGMRLASGRYGPQKVAPGNEPAPAVYYSKHLEAQNIKHFSESCGPIEYRTQYIKGFDFSENILANQLNHCIDWATKNSEQVQSEFFVPGTISIRNHELPTMFVDHHFCHANYAYFYSPQNRSIVCTHDGSHPGTPFRSGGIYVTSENGVIPVIDHRLCLGYLYDLVACHAGVGGDPGKLMGLSSYALPDTRAFAILQDIFSLATKPYHAHEIDLLAEKLIELSSKRTLTQTNQIRRFKFSDQIKAQGIQAAANAQMIVENAFLYSVGTAASLIAEVDESYGILNLTGGFTLNCPTNSALKQRHCNLSINPLPGCGDTGISIGAGVAAHKVLGIPLKRESSQDMSSAFPPLKFNISFSENDFLKYQLVRHEVACTIPEFIAERILEKKILCLFRGRSEVGPRALGRRSIIAYALLDEIRNRINISKGRETWRPLAPICRVEDYDEYFDGNADDSKFMLFTNRVKDNSLKGITHVDGTARVQAITQQDPWIHEALGIIKSKGGTPVIINTSFNCAGEPIVETIQHAFRSFSLMNFDYLVTEHGIFKKADS